MNRRTKVLLGLAATVVVVIPATVTATTAAWNDTEWVHGEGLGTSVLDCGTTEGFAATSYGRFLSGQLLGQNLDPLATLEPMALAVDGAGTLEVEPSDAIAVGPQPPYTYVNPLQVSALGGIVGLNLTGLGVGLPVGSAGAVNQYAQVAGGGGAAGAAGLVTDSGGVLVSASTPGNQLPEPATITLDSLLPGITGIAGTDLEIGAVAASSVLDGCAALYSSVWGDGAVTGVTRQYGTAEFGLELESPLVGDLVDGVGDTIDLLDAALAELIGPGGLIGDEIAAELDLALPASIAGVSVSGTVALEGVDLEAIVAPLLTTPLSDGVVTVDLANGLVDVDLTELLNPGPNGLNNLPPNTELVVNSTVLNGVADRVGVLIDAWNLAVVNALTEALDGLQLTIALTTSIRALALPYPLVNVTIGLSGDLGAVLDGDVPLTIGAAAAGGLPALIDSILGGLGLPTIGGIIGTVLGLTGPVLAGVTGVIQTVLYDVVTDLGDTLTDVTDDLVIALDGVVDALPSVLSVMVNVQPDRAGAPPGATYTPATEDATAQYLVSALRIGLADFDTPNDIAHVTLGTASAGPVALP